MAVNLGKAEAIRTHLRVTRLYGEEQFTVGEIAVLTSSSPRYVRAVIAREKSREFVQRRDAENREWLRGLQAAFKKLHAELAERHEALQKEVGELRESIRRSTGRT